MLKLNTKVKRVLVVLSLVLVVSVSAVSNQSYFATPTSFLPMEDAFSAARTTPEFANENIKPYRQSFNLGSQSAQRGYIDFTSTDILAFVFLMGVYLMFIRRKPQSRSASF